MLPFGDSAKTSRLPYVTYVLILINIIAFLIELSTPNFDSFIRIYAFTPALFSIFNPATWWPIFTAAFLHAGFTHILFNMLFLWVFGDNVEESLGRFGYLLFYLGATISAALLQYIVDPHTGIPMLGASGAIAGILGYYLIVFPRHRIKTLLFFAVVHLFGNYLRNYFLAYWAITQLFSGFGSLLSAQDGGTAWFAHIGGLLFGILIGVIVQQTRKEVVQEYEIVS